MICNRPRRLELTFARFPVYFVTFSTRDRRKPTFDLSKWIGGLKRTLSVALKASGDGPIWQPGFFDHVLRSDESYAQKWEYVRDNPVRAGLVAQSDDWPYQGEVVVIDRA